MSEKKRLSIMAAVFAVLIFANFYSYVIQDDFDNSGFFGGAPSVGDYGPKIQHALKALKDAPELNFRFEREEATPDFEALRNPFIFGVDQRLQQQRQAEMERLEAIREEMANQAAQQADQIQTQIVEADPEAEALKDFGGKIIGIMEDKNGGERVAVMRVNDEIVIVGPGMDVGNGFHCLAITYGEVTLERKQDGQRFDISLETE